MSRKEEIQQASFEYHSKPYLGAIKDDFVNGAEWADETMLDKVCKYLYRKLENGKVLSSQLIDDLRKAMEE